MQAGNFFGGSLSEGKLVPNNDAFAKLAEGEKYEGTLKVIEIDILKHRLNEKKGLMCEVKSLVFKFELTLTGDAFADMDNTMEVSTWLPMVYAEPSDFEPSKAERREFSDRVKRAERAIGPAFAQSGAPLQPDPDSGDRLAPTPEDESPNGRWGSEDAWAVIETGGVAGDGVFSVKIKRSVSDGVSYTNWDIVKPRAS